MDPTELILVQRTLILNVLYSWSRNETQGSWSTSYLNSIHLQSNKIIITSAPNSNDFLIWINENIFIALTALTVWRTPLPLKKKQLCPAILLFCLMNQLFGDQVSWHTLRCFTPKIRKWNTAYTYQIYIITLQFFWLPLPLKWSVASARTQILGGATYKSEKYDYKLGSYSPGIIAQ